MVAQSISNNIKHTPYISKNLDHLGLVSAMMSELEIAKQIDESIPKTKQKISTGKLIEAMILNGLGFTSKALYLTEEYFADKPVERLLGEGIQAADLNFDALGRALDSLHDFNQNALYSKISSNACKILGLSSKIGHLDSTSFHVDGEYNSLDFNPNDNTNDNKKQGVVHVTKGYSLRS